MLRDGHTDGRMDRPSYRDARTHLKRGEETQGDLRGIGRPKVSKKKYIKQLLMIQNFSSFFVFCLVFFYGQHHYLKLQRKKLNVDKRIRDG